MSKKSGGYNHPFMKKLGESVKVYPYTDNQLAKLKACADIINSPTQNELFLNFILELYPDMKAIHKENDSSKYKSTTFMSLLHTSFSPKGGHKVDDVRFVKYNYLPYGALEIGGVRITAQKRNKIVASIEEYIAPLVKPNGRFKSKLNLDMISLEAHIIENDRQKRREERKGEAIAKAKAVSEEAQKRSHTS